MHDPHGPACRGVSGTSGVNRIIIRPLVRQAPPARPPPPSPRRRRFASLCHPMCRSPGHQLTMPDGGGTLSEELFHRVRISERQMALEEEPVEAREGPRCRGRVLGEELPHAHLRLIDTDEAAIMRRFRWSCQAPAPPRPHGGGGVDLVAAVRPRCAPLSRFGHGRFLLALTASGRWQPASGPPRRVEKRLADEHGGSEREVPGEHWYGDRCASEPRDY